MPHYEQSINCKAINPILNNSGLVWHAVVTDVNCISSSLTSDDRINDSRMLAAHTWLEAMQAAGHHMHVHATVMMFLLPCNSVRQQAGEPLRHALQSGASWHAFPMCLHA